MNRLAAALLTLLLALALAAPALAAKPKVGDVLADPTAKVELKPADAAALGLSAGVSSIRLSQIKGETIFIKVYSLYCPRCQSDAPKVNRVFERLKASPKARNLALLALAAGDTPFEVEFFRKKFQAPMPMMPDTDYVLHKALLSVGAPSYFVLRPLPGGKGLKVLFFLEGAFEDENAFFENVLRAIATK
jgi:thiol-disulfide isomerase/thioredoxin